MNQTIEDLRNQFGCTNKDCGYYNYNRSSGSCCNDESAPWYNRQKCYIPPDSINPKPANKSNIIERYYYG